LIITNQFFCLHQEGPFNHHVTFYEGCATLGTNSNDEDTIYLKLFPFSLTGKAKIWLQSHPSQSFTNSEDLEKKFLVIFFSPSKYISVKATIATFSQGFDEHFLWTLGKIQGIVKKCSNHGFDDITKLNLFYNGLRPQTRVLLDASARGKMMLKELEEATIIIESLAASNH